MEGYTQEGIVKKCVVKSVGNVSNILRDFRSEFEVDIVAAAAKILRKSYNRENARPRCGGDRGQSRLEGSKRGRRISYGVARATNASSKGKYGDNFYSRTWHMQKREGVLKVKAYNFRQVIKFSIREMIEIWDLAVAMKIVLNPEYRTMSSVA